MRPITLLSAGAIALTALVPTTVSAGDRATDHHLEALRLECAARVTDAGPAVRCEWSEPTAPSAVAVKLFRLDLAFDDHRRVVYRSGELGITGFTDTEVRTGHRYAYAVVAYGEDGRVVARSRAEWVRVPSAHDVEVLRLHCSLGPAREAVGCEWSRPESQDAYVVSLWRSVDGGQRELVERFRPSGPNAYRDPVPGDATTITYAVIVAGEDGSIVARSRLESVRIPTIDVERAGPIRVGSRTP